MINFAKLLLFAGIVFLLSSCQSKEFADTIIINGNVATVDESNPRVEAIAIKEGKIFKLGSTSDIKDLVDDHTHIIDAKGQFVMPGFIEGHGHFSGLGWILMNLNFLNSKNWDEIVQMVEAKVKESKPGEWIVGRGWHQEKWNTALEKSVNGYPSHEKLSSVSPDNPVMLKHASGHSYFANKRAMEISGVNKETPNPFGGEIVRDATGNAIGVFEEKAMDIIKNAHNEYLSSLSAEEKYEEWVQSIRLAEEECLKKGITSFQDAGSKVNEINDYEGLAEKNDLNLRLWVMIRDGYDNLAGHIDNYPKINVGGNHLLTISAIKGAVDGALGAFGAWLLQPYADKPDFIGQNTTKITDLKKIADLAIANDLQFCIHAIGDRANKVVLDLYDATFAAHPDKKDLRWRIEHAQHLDTADIPRFKEMKIIASMQGIHCTSDAPFVEKRLGQFRAKYGSYPWRSLLDNRVIIANGTDAPVEDVDPIPSFYASVTRKRIDNGFEFYPEQSMTRNEALYSYTLGNAYAAFEEDIKGSLSEGKLADIVILSEDLLNCSDEEILDTEVLYTIVGGEVKYQKAQ